MIEVTHDALEEKPLHWNVYKGIMSSAAQRVYLALREEERTIVLSYFAKEVGAGQATVITAFRQLEAAGLLSCDDDLENIKVLECPKYGHDIQDKENPENLIDVWAACFLRYTEKTYQRGPGDVWQSRKMPKGRSVTELSDLIRFFWAEMNNGQARNFSYFVKEINSIIAYKAQLDRNLV